MCDRDNTVISHGQGGFIEHIVMPIFEHLSFICPNIIEVQLENACKNIYMWNQIKSLEDASLSKIGSDKSQSPKSIDPDTPKFALGARDSEEFE